MKKALLLLLVVTGVFASCKKERSRLKQSSKETHQYIQRVWFTTADKLEYYNTTNNKLYEQSNTPGVRYVISDTLVKVTDLQGNVTKGKYLLSQSNGKDMITVVLKGQAETFEIVSITDSTMSWKQEKSNQTYMDNGEKTAAKQIHNIEFHCPCKPKN